MAVPICITLDDPPEPPSINLPFLGELQAVRQSLYDLPELSTYLMQLQGNLTVSLTPLRGFLELLEIVILIKNCVESLIDALMPPRPGPIIDCFKNLAAAFKRLTKLFPPWSYVHTMLDVVDYIFAMTDEVYALFQELDDRITSVAGVLDLATARNDTDLAALLDCTSDETRLLTVNAAEALSLIVPLAKLFLEPLARITGSSQMKDALQALDSLNGTVSSLKDSYRQAVSLPVLSPLLTAIDSMRKALAIVYNVAAPIVGRTGNKYVSPPPALTHL